jgi:glycosyltransferase involved in cell wall biosynthesis
VDQDFVSRRCLVVSAVNFTEGGPLTVLQDFVEAACAVLPPEWDIVAFVNNRALLTHPRPTLIEVPEPKHSWLRRLQVEWRGFRSQARRLNPDLWVSLHDISPNVGATPQAVYCHNPSPFFRMGLRDVWFDPSLLLFQLGYSLLYRVNLRRNRAVVVQQSWLREEFRRWLGPGTNIIVAHPAATGPFCNERSAARRQSDRSTFLYPALPRAFKNFELLCRAARQLESNPQWRSEIVLTVDGSENRYARWLWRRFGKLRSLRFVGRQSREQMRDLYERSDCLLFPSRMETWGLPITEAKRYRLPMFISDLPFAHETVGTYDAVDFIDVHDPAALAGKLLKFQNAGFRFESVRARIPEAPFVQDWAALVRLLAGLSDA